MGRLLNNGVDARVDPSGHAVAVRLGVASAKQLVEKGSD